MTETDLVQAAEEVLRSDRENLYRETLHKQARFDEMKEIREDRELKHVTIKGIEKRVQESSTKLERSVKKTEHRNSTFW